jgi:hypothetical protein
MFVVFIALLLMIFVDLKLMQDFVENFYFYCYHMARAPTGFGGFEIGLRAKRLIYYLYREIIERMGRHGLV